MKLKCLRGLIPAATCATAAFLTGICGDANAASVYLNDQNISVSLGSNTIGSTGNPTEPFNNLSTAASLANVIDAPSASSPENHISPTTHVWVTGILELEFDFGKEYDLETLHFWNYFAEDFDVDNVDFTFFDSANNNVGTLAITPKLGGNNGNPIFAENYDLSFPSNVQFVTAVLTGTNNQVDLNNIGFTGKLSDTNPPITTPEPSSLLSFVVLGSLGAIAAQKKQIL